MKQHLGNIEPTVLYVAIDDNATPATGTLTSDNTNVSNADTVTIGSTEYTFVTSLTTDPATVPYEVLIGANADESLANLAAAINGGEGEGTTYATGTEAHTLVTAGAVDTDNHTLIVTAIDAGYAGNAIASTETATHLEWGGSVLSGGGSTVGTATVSGEGGLMRALISVAPQLVGTPTYTISITDKDGNVVYTTGSLNENATTRTALEQMMSPSDIITVTTSSKVEETTPIIIHLR